MRKSISAALIYSQVVLANNVLPVGWLVRASIELHLNAYHKFCIAR